MNARLLYTNKVLGNVSLNERQKKQIAESISKSKSVDEAKTIYETLQRTAQTVAEKRAVPQSLTEAITRNSSPFLPRASQAIVDPISDRWQRMAGIKK
jgi:signal-transduction protein with cAMP-binding, CBS, and nucleotidyltransferase domain